MQRWSSPDPLIIFRKFQWLLVLKNCGSSCSFLPWSVVSGCVSVAMYSSEHKHEAEMEAFWQAKNVIFSPFTQNGV